MAGWLFRNHKPLFGRLGLPITCLSDPSGNDCCASCKEWTNCLNRLPLELKSEGFSVEPWLNWLCFSNSPTREGNGTIQLTGDGDPSIAFSGTYVAFAPPTFDSQYAVDGGGQGYCGTHEVNTERTFTTPNDPFGDAVRSLRLFLRASCTLDEYDNPVIVFRVFMYVEIITWRNSIDDVSGNCDELLDRYSPICCEILNSNPIPINDDLSLTDLVDVPLFPIDPQTDENYAICWGDDFLADCGLYAYDSMLGPPYIRPEAESDWIAPAGTQYSVSVLIGDCLKPQECGNCPPPEPPQPGYVSEAIEIDFSYSPSSCYKTFEAIYPDCITPIGFWWSFGKTGERVGHPISNKDITGLTPQEWVTLTIIDDRGCVYQKTKLVTCGCPCPGVSGHLDITTRGPTDPEVDPHYYVVMTAIIDAPPGCFPFIELCELTGLNQYDDCIECVDPVQEHCMAECLTLGPNTSFELVADVESPITVRCFMWRLWDGPCGCPSEWNRFSLPVGFLDDCGNEIFI